MNNGKYYHLLGLHEGASIQEIKTAYRKLALRYHPDKNMSKHESEKFKMITEAYRILRTEYEVPRKNSNLNYYHRQNDLSSKIPYFNEINLEKIFKKCWSSSYAEKAYEGISKYEQESWMYCKRVMHYTTATILSSIATQYNYISSRCTLYDYSPLFKRRLKTVKSKIKFS